jgi:hypothetical protein
LFKTSRRFPRFILPEPQDILIRTCKITPAAGETTAAKNHITGHAQPFRTPLRKDGRERETENDERVFGGGFYQ